MNIIIFIFIYVLSFFISHFIIITAIHNLEDATTPASALTV